MTNKQEKEIEIVIKILKKHLQNHQLPIIELIEEQTDDPEKVLIGTILSARTKDEVTASAVRKLFKKVNKISDLKKLSEKEIQKLIYPVGFYKNKAKYLKQLPITLEKEFKGVLPDIVEELIKLPGVGRKTANLVIAVGFKKPALCIDIHCHRIPQRIGWLVSKTP